MDGSHLEEKQGKAIEGITEKSKSKEDSFSDCLMCETSTGNKNYEKLNIDLASLHDVESKNSFVKRDKKVENQAIVDSEYPANTEMRFSQTLHKIIQEEESISTEVVPILASTRNVRNSSINVCTGNMIPLQMFGFQNKTFEWFECSQKLLYNPNGIPFGNFRRKQHCSYIPYLEYGKVIEVMNTDLMAVCFKSDNDIRNIESVDFQKLICKSLNSHNLTVVIFGVDEEKKITGCPLYDQEKDNFRRKLEAAVESGIGPPIENIHDVLDVQFLKVEKHPTPLESFLVMLKIRQLCKNTKYSVKLD